MEQQEMGLKDIQQNCLEVLREFDAYTRAHGLRYFLSGGTLLGAVRHKGYIPWDDDVDVMMPREDYERLAEEYKSNRFVFSCCDNDPEYTTPFGRLWDSETTLEWHNLHNRSIGIYIDIFPMDGYPANPFIAKLYFLILKYKRSIVSLTTKVHLRRTENFRWVKLILQKIYNKGANYYSRKMNAYVRRMKYSECQYVGVTTTKGHLKRERNPRSVFDEILYMDFEGMQLPAPKGYDTYLRQLYAGDYMELPPVEKRVSVHNWKAYRNPKT